MQAPMVYPLFGSSLSIIVATVIQIYKNLKHLNIASALVLTTVNVPSLTIIYENTTERKFVDSSVQNISNIQCIDKYNRLAIT